MVLPVSGEIFFLLKKDNEEVETDTVSSPGVLVGVAGVASGHAGQCEKISFSSSDWPEIWRFIPARKVH